MSIVSVRDLVKAYGKGRTQVRALRGVSLEIGDGEMLALMGPSGSGKTTFLHLVAGIDLPTAGTVFVDGRELTELTDSELAGYRREQVGIVFQFFNLVPDLTASENVELPLRFARHMAQKRRRAEELLALVEMANRKNHFPDELSGGEQQRVAIAVALANDPPILLADEPTGELDGETGIRIVALLRDLSKRFGKTTIVATHDTRIASIADRIAWLRDGQIESIERIHIAGT